MPISINYDREENVIYSVAEGVINIEDIFGYYAEIVAIDPLPDYRALADYRGVNPDLDYIEMSQLSEQRRGLSNDVGNVKIAVVTDNDLSFGLARMYQSLLDDDHYTVMSFRDISKARNWLGL